MGSRRVLARLRFSTGLRQCPQAQAHLRTRGQVPGAGRGQTGDLGPKGAVKVVLVMAAGGEAARAGVAGDPRLPAGADAPNHRGRTATVTGRPGCWGWAALGLVRQRQSPASYRFTFCPPAAPAASASLANLARKARDKTRFGVPSPELARRAMPATMPALQGSLSR